MLNTARAYRGMITAPHHLAAQAGLDVLREDGNAVEAMIAAAAAIAVVYPHMNSIGGDSFWLIDVPGQNPLGIDACGATGAGINRELYARNGYSVIPSRGPLAANTVAGTLSGWAKAEQTSHALSGHLPLDRLLRDAIYYAEEGIPVTSGQQRLTQDKRDQMDGAPGFSELFMPGGKVPSAGSRFTNAALAETLRLIAREGPQSFYDGSLSQRVAADLARAEIPLDRNDLARHEALSVTPLSVNTSVATLYNMPPPTQGVSSLQIMALFERMGVKDAESFAHIHGLVEATKQAFLVRNAEVCDPEWMARSADELLATAEIERMLGAIDGQRARPWPEPTAPGDTIWMGTTDRHGVSVSFIQSIYWEFGSGVVLEETGINWQNRGSSFSLDPHSYNALAPGRRPFHTLNPALARFHDGRVMPYGTMGGEGQPQTQSAVLSRYALGQELQQAITAPRWLLGKTWGEETTTLKLESRFDAKLVADLRDAGHDVEIVEAFSDAMGHAGAIVRHPDGLLEGATDPRSDGTVAAY
jgi:oxamate amidohydrolase